MSSVKWRPYIQSSTFHPSTSMSQSKHPFNLPSRRTQMNCLEMMSPSVMPLWTWRLKVNQKMVRLVMSRRPRPLRRAEVFCSCHYFFFNVRIFWEQIMISPLPFGVMQTFFPFEGFHLFAKLCLIRQLHRFFDICLWMHLFALFKYALVFADYGFYQYSGKIRSY